MKGDEGRVKGKRFAAAAFLLLLFALHASLFTASAQAADTQSADQRYHGLISELRCLVCQNQTIAESNAPLAADLREQVRAQIAQGRSDAEIVEFVTARYGDFVLYRPPFKTSTWLLWLGPFAGLLLAGLVALMFVRRSRAAAAPGEPEPEAPAAAATAERLPVSAIAAATFGLLVFGGAWYVLAGSWRTQAIIDLARADPAAAQQQAMAQTLERLQEHLEKKPDDAEAWAWLGRARTRQERYAEGAAALARANELSGGQNPDWLVEEGEALAYAHGRDLDGAPAERFAQALAISPAHPRALWFAGLAALHAGDDAGALRHWQQLAAQDLPAEVSASLEHSLAELRRRTGAAAPPAPLRLELEVTVAPELQTAVPPEATLFVYAQTADGANPPLAARRIPRPRFPVRVTLDDSHSMLPGRPLSGAAGWRLRARLSASGEARAQPGDLEGELPVSRAQAGRTHNLRIDKRVD